MKKIKLFILLAAAVFAAGCDDKLSEVEKTGDLSPVKETAVIPSTFATSEIRLYVVEIQGQSYVVGSSLHGIAICPATQPKKGL